MSVITGCRFTRALLVLAGLLLLAVLSPAFPLLAQSAPTSAIPHNAVVIERARVPVTVHPDRELLLWMISPVKHDRGPLSSENAYTCPEMTLGSYYSGPTRLSLLDTRSGQLINTIKLLSPELDDKTDEFDIPYRIVSGGYYLVPGVPKEGEGKPALLKLRDLNGDGIAAETAFFEAEACMGLPTTLIGYSVTQDKVIQYQAEIEVTEFERKVTGDRLGPKHRTGKPKVETQVWIDYLLSEKPGQPGHWKYKIDYSGRGGCEDSYDVRYDPAGEKFVGTLTELCDMPDHEPPAKN